MPLYCLITYTTAAYHYKHMHINELNEQIQIDIWLYAPLNMVTGLVCASMRITELFNAQV